MVDEAYELLNSKTKITNEQSLDKHEFLDTNLLLPKLDIETTITKLYWKNIQAYLTIINRPDEHFIIFIKNELCNNKINWYSRHRRYCESSGNELSRWHTHCGNYSMTEKKQKLGWFSRLKQGLKKSSSALTEGITGIFTKKRLDASTLKSWRIYLLCLTLA